MFTQLCVGLSERCKANGDAKRTITGGMRHLNDGAAKPRNAAGVRRPQYPGVGEP